MAEILGAASAGTKLFLEVNAISIDNWTFKLFYKATTTLCLACSVVASSKQFFGDPINCEVVSTYCSRIRCRYGWSIRIFRVGELRRSKAGRSDRSCLF